MRHLRGLLIALAVLAISAGVALAGRALPQAAGNGLGVAAEASGKQVPVRAEQAEPEQAEASPDVDADEDTDTAKDATTDEDAGAQGEHGALVSEAAQGDTPEGWANHGAYVSAVARGLAKPGDPAPEGSGGRVKPSPAPDTAGDQPTPKSSSAKGKSASHRPSH